MSEEYSFVQQIRQDPHDDTPRLIFADFLDDAGDPQGELIRVQVELAGLSVGDPRRRPLIQREQQLLDEHGDAWLAPLRQLGAEGVNVRCFQRGLIERVKISARQFMETGDALCQIAPALHCLELRDIAEVAGRIADVELPPQITALDLSSKRLTAIELGQLRGATWLDQIVQLQLSANRLGDDGIEILTGHEYKQLHSLSLDMNGLGPDAATALASWPTLGQLTRLSLSVNRLGDDGMQQLTSSVFLGSLQRLDLASNGIEDRGARLLATAAGFKSLAELNLRSNRIGADGMQHFMNLPFSRQLTGIDVRGNHNDAMTALQQAMPTGVVRAL